MAKPDKAQITYEVDSGGTKTETVLRFHTVIAEEHEASADITKFPVQSGFSISNHTVKKNRRVTIRGAVTNHQIVGAEEFHEYGGGNSSRIMYSALRELIRQSVICKVQTNLTTYDPVVFTKLKTKQQVGSTDIMDFTLTGEEVQLGSTVNQTTPTLLVFTPLTDQQREARIDELKKANIPVSEGVIISEAAYDPNESFQIETKGVNGKNSITTFEKTGYDPVTKAYSHKVHTSDVDVAEPTEDKAFNWVQLLSDPESALPDIDLPFGASAVSPCLVGDGISLVREEVTEVVDTALGTLTKSVYGAIYGAFGVNGDRSFGQKVLSLGVDCFISGATGDNVSVDPMSENFIGKKIPTAEEALEGAAEIGNSISDGTAGKSVKSTITKISGHFGESGFFGDIL